MDRSPTAAFTIDRTDPDNRVMRATRFIKRGEDVFRSEPIVLVNISFMRGVVCNYCLGEAELMKCAKCKQA